VEKLHKFPLCGLQDIRVLGLAKNKAATLDKVTFA